MPGPHAPAPTTPPTPEAQRARVRRFRAVYGLFALAFAASAAYLGLRTPTYWDAGGLERAAHFAALAAAVAGLGLAVRAVRSVRAGDPRLGVFGRGALWRYAACALAASVALTCAFGEANPRAVFRALLLLAATAHLAPLSSTAAYRRARRLLHARIGRAADVAAFNLVLFVALAELALRVLGAVVGGPLLCAPDVKAAKRIADHKLAPGEAHLGFPANRLGFYDTDWTREKPPGAARILGVADSFGVETVAYDENFLTLLEGELERRPAAGGPVEVLNLSVDATSPAAYRVLIAEYLAPYQADGALVCVFAGNDVLWLPERDPDLAFLRADFWYVGFVTRRLARLASGPLAQAPADGQRTRVARDEASPAADAPTFTDEAFLAIELRRLPVCLRRGVDERVDAKYAELGRILADIRALTRGRVVVAVVPDQFQVDDALWHRLMLAGPGGPDQYARDRPQREIAALCEHAGIPVVDLLPALREAADAGPVYHPRDTHWNARGHRAAAAHIAQALAPRVGAWRHGPAQPQP